MEKYQEIYNYLQTFPAHMTVGELIGNMDKAEVEFIENQKKQIKEIKENFVGNTYYFEESDDEEVVCKYITYVKEFTKKSVTDMVFSCELIVITPNSVHYEEDAHVDLKGLRMAKKVDKEVFDTLKERFYNIKSYSI